MGSRGRNCLISCVCSELSGHTRTSAQTAPTEHLRSTDRHQDETGLSSSEEGNAKLRETITLAANGVGRNEEVIAGTALKGSGREDSDRFNYANLDLLRSLAVLSVVATHFWQQSNAVHLWNFSDGTRRLFFEVSLNLSFTGVMFFFVHTCLVLMLSMHRAPDAHRWRNFLIRRAFRIYPLCWATILLVLATGLTDQPDGFLHTLGWRGIAANFLLVQNMFHKGANSGVIAPLWSLPWEVQMYLLLPFFFNLFRRFDRFCVALGVWLGATVLMEVVALKSIPLHTYLHGTFYIPMFVGGMVAYRALVCEPAKQYRGMLPAAIWPFFILSLFALQCCLMGRSELRSAFGGGVDACICLLLGLAIPAFAQLRAKWIVIPTQQIAKYSYGIYLLHMPALIFVLRYLPGLPLALMVLAFLSLTVLLSYASFNLIEDPLIRVGKRLTHTSQKPRRPRFTTTAELSFLRVPTAEQGVTQRGRRMSQP